MVTLSYGQMKLFPAVRLILLPLIAVVIFNLAGCATNPITGRSQTMMMSRQSEESIGHESFQQLLRQVKAVNNPAQQRMVKTIFDRVTLAAEKLYFAKTGTQLGFVWQIVLIDKPKEINAFALPGGKFGIFSGILPIAKTNAGLAAIIGHEAAHALLRHAAERYSNMQILGLGGAVIGATAGGDAANIYGVAAQYGYALPFSRSQETEADIVGLELSSMAGYDPRAVIGVWQRMDAAAGGNKPPEFASTHPNPGSRIEELERIMPYMMQIYDRSQKQKTVVIPGLPNQ